MTIDMSQFYQVFFEETAEHLAEMESLLLGLDVAAPDAEQLNAIFRAAHSIKGSSGTFGFTDLAEVTHILENLLDRIRKHELALRDDMVDAFLAAGDTLQAMLAAHRGGTPVAADTVAGVCATLRALSGAAGAPAHDAAPAPSPALPAMACYALEFVPTPEATADPAALANLLDELRALGELTVLERPADGAAGGWRLQLATAAPPAQIEDLLAFVAADGAWRVTSASGEVVDAGGAFGLFAEETPADEGYGFFEPLPTTASPAAEEGDGFGFFDPLPVPEAPPSAEAPPAIEEGDGFGLFLPLPEPLPAAAEPAAEPAAAAPAPAGRKARPLPAAAGESASIRVSVERADQLINLVGELVITQAMLLQCAAQMNDAAPEALLGGLAQLERNTRGLQEAVMSIRMMPISFVFSRFPRVVRDLSSKLGKQVELKMSGESTELDKGLIERIADPLTHLIRNSLDHGIEPPEQRLAAGKPAAGTITLKAAHQGGNIVIEVGDDGAGLNRQRILAKARERGFAVSDQMPDQEVWALIFEAGFSTADVVTDVSGRGVGMDVVRRNIQAMGGRIEIESMPGIGTRMTVRLPLTLAILDGMSVAVGEHTYILPLSYVIESLQPAAGDVKTVSNQGRVIQVRGEYLPVVSLQEMFRVPGAETDFTRGIMIVLDADGAKAALFVDALVGQHQVVIKSLEQNYRRVPGISGATIMGDGRVALILDVSALIDAARTTPQAAEAVPA
ncbi:chemotaxis protein CheW [Azospira restricta]|uniref:Chemotaxis protein CheA n=1 Tax=Azospira restricta TaxID=404405 RepID=A0A974SS37_9RHOO|nr:chemotaxis protein CheW [Azospira restricta]QRJ65427.1 chemotaxis protein CheW [Azospira restricta]